MAIDAVSSAEWAFQNELNRQEQPDPPAREPDDATVRAARFVMHVDCECTAETGRARIACYDCGGLGIRTIAVPFERILDELLNTAVRNSVDAEKSL